MCVKLGLTLTEECKLRVLETRLLRIFTPKNQSK